MQKISAVTVALIALFTIACNTPASTPSPTQGPSVAPTSAGPTTAPATDIPATPAPTPPATSTPTGFYLRASTSQALPPIHTFNWLPTLTISDGIAIDGNVAVPAIYPGPLLIVPFARTITEAGTDAIAAEAERLGLLGGETDFTGGTSMPGSATAHLVLTIDGTTYELIGAPDAVPPCQADECNGVAGTAPAFSAFWQEIQQLDPWLADELGPLEDYTPERVAMLLYPPQPGEGMVPEQVEWPLEPFEDLGVEFPGETGVQCTTLSGADLDTVLPLLTEGNELTIFIDSNGEGRQAKAVVVVPGALSPCPDEPTEQPLKQ